MFTKGKLPIFLGSFLIMLYGVSAEFLGKEAYKELRVFMDVIDKIDDDYVEAPDMNKVQEGAMRGLTIVEIDVEGDAFMPPLDPALNPGRDAWPVFRRFIPTARASVSVAICIPLRWRNW